MKVNLQDFRWIDLYVNDNKDIVIFPIGKINATRENPDGTIYSDLCYYPAYFPIELKYPYTNYELAEKIQIGIEQWDKHEPYNDFSGKNTFEEKYYGIKGFKKAIKGKRYIRLGWDDMQGKYVSLSLPTKSGYCYLGVDEVILDENAGWIDFSNAVIRFTDLDIDDIPYAKLMKNRLNL